MSATTGELLDAVRAFVLDYVVMTPPQADATALWVLHTHAFEASEATPYLAIHSAEKESGKTRLLETLEQLVARPWLTGRVTAAVLARKIAKECPTLLLDESDAAFGGDREYAETLRGILNSGYRLGGRSSLCIGQGSNISYADLSTFCAKAFAGIGKLPDTVASRSIPIVMKRRARDEQVRRFRAKHVRRDAEPLAQALEAWAQAHVDALAEAEPEIPEQLGDRAADVWEPLLAIADAAGEPWSERARRAALELSTGQEVEDDSIGVRLLADIRDLFSRCGEDRIASATLADGLNDLAEAPWGNGTAARGSRRRPSQSSCAASRFAPAASASTMGRHRRATSSSSSTTLSSVSPI